MEEYPVNVVKNDHPMTPINMVEGVQTIEEGNYPSGRKTAVHQQEKQLDYRALVRRLTDQVTDEIVLRRVWKVLERAYSQQ